MTTVILRRKDGEGSVAVKRIARIYGSFALSGAQDDTATAQPRERFSRKG